MSTFKSLNVESDNESEDEVDNTKEIQIEEALKLYQAALKYHSEGPASFEQAAEAYKALFESEIFKYTESLSEYKRHELFGESLEFDNILQDESDVGPIQLAGGNESAPNTLPQILHLSYKNHGLFMLETMQYWLRQHGTLPPQERDNQILGALTHFSEALDKEDTDLDLWLRTASVAALLGSRRITRFCLEAVLDGDDELLDSILRLPGLEEGFAGQQLRELVEKLEDTLSLMQAPLSTMKRKKLSEKLRNHLNPYPSAPLPSEIQPAQSTPVKQPEKILLNPSKWDWAGVGEVILHQFMAEQSGFVDFVPGSCVNVAIPPDANAEEGNVSEKPSVVGDAAIVSPPMEVEPTQNGSSRLAAEDGATGGRNGGQEQDVVMEEGEKSAATKTDDVDSTTPQEAALPQSRKRSTDSAGLPETAEGGRVRSKRIRARETVTDGSTGPESVGPDPAKQLEDQLYPFIHADQCLFEIVNDDFERLGVDSLGSPQKLRAYVTNSDSSTSLAKGIEKASRDLYTAIQSGDQNIAAVMLSNEPVNLGGMTREAGLNAFLGHAKSSTSPACVKPALGAERLRNFAEQVNTRWLSVRELAFSWLEMLICPGTLPSPSGLKRGKKSSYMHYRWAEDLKRFLVQIIVNCDDYIYSQFLQRVEELSNRTLSAQAKAEIYNLSEWDIFQIEMVQTLFELHLDIYSLIKHPNSGVDLVTQTLQKDRLERWSTMARDTMQLRSDIHPDDALDELALRHIWATVFHMSVSENITPEHVIYAMEELKLIFQSIDKEMIEVQNNAVMPELSVAAVDRELARISMKDFFLKVFDQDEKDPVAVIESLEPILEMDQEVEQHGDAPAAGNEEDHVDSQCSSTVGPSADAALVSSVSRPSPSQEMRKFLDTATVPLRLSLWQRLREAYEAIEYPPKVLSCYLRSIETLIEEFKSIAYQESLLSDRQMKLANRLRIIDEIIVKVLQIIRGEKTAFDCLTYEHMQTSMTAISELLRILSAINFLHDMLRVGQCTAPRFEGCASGTFHMITARLQDMQLRAWILQYYLLKEGISQTPAAFPTASDDLFEFLRHVHYATGVRGFCHLAGRQFLRLAKDEMLRLDDVIDANNRDTELAQVLYDLYGLKTFDQPLDCHEFGSSPEPLDKKTSTQLLSFIMSQAAKISIKDLPKTDLKVSIDKIHGSLGRPKTNEDISMNRKILNTYFKSPINPISLFNSLKGVGSLSTKHIPAQAAPPASKGWYFLMGNIALNKFRSQKRLTQGPTEDLNFAQAFFLQDLEYSIDRWETWYRLAQANDSQLEEAVSWNVDKLNSNSVELIHFQRAAIHCYVMAVATATVDADTTSETVNKISELYTDFGNRIYASSREPFSMIAFQMRESEHKYYSGTVSQHVYQHVPFVPLTAYTAWKFAAVLFRRAINRNPDKWWNHYMLGKCLWKMYCASTDAAAAAAARGETSQLPKGPTWEEVLGTFVGAIETMPEKKERQQPVLEPHYKLVSVVHKLFLRKVIDYEKGHQILQDTSFAHNLGSPGNAEDWERYILAVLKALRSADKQGWHHRIIARIAHVIYDDSNEAMVAMAAKGELTERIFTKTMAVQVWKPEHERPGRHFVYTTRYTRFFAQLLVQTGDIALLEPLTKRVRRKATDFFEHTKLWQDLCQAYLKMLRKKGNVPDGNEDAVFKAINNEEFQVRATRLEAWCQSSTSQHPVLDILRDVLELKRVNNGLMKPLLIDDLIGDTYALLYSTVGSTLDPLPSEHQPPQIQPPLVGPSPPVLAPAGPLPIPAVAQVQVDGAAELASNLNLPFSVYRPSQLHPPHPQPQPDPVPKPRAKAVGRREIQRKAEACTVKASTPIATSASIPIRSPTATNQPQLILPAQPSTDKTSNESTHTAINNEQLQIPNSGTATAAASVVNAESSAPASVHDSADDESELSELDESEVQEIQEAADIQDPPEHSHAKSLFPHLAAHKEKLKEVDSSVVSEDVETSEE